MLTNIYKAQNYIILYYRQRDGENAKREENLGKVFTKFPACDKI